MISLRALRTVRCGRFAAVAMDDDVLDDDDGVVDDETDGRGEAAEGHQVEALADSPEKEDGDGDGDGDNEAGDERGASSRAGRERG